MANNNTKLASLIRQMRAYRGISQEQLSKESGVSKSSISKLELGQLNPSLKTIQIICDSLKCKFNYKIEPIEEE